MATNKNTMISNVVPYDVLRTVQLFTFAALRDAIIGSFGPRGSNTMVLKDDMLPKYTKDGHEILSAIHFNNGIEQSVKENMLNLTSHIVKEVGDGTTSAVILSSIIFEKLCFGEVEQKMKPYQVGQYFKAISDMIAEEITARGRECTLEDIYDIAMISSNSNKEVAENMKDIYENYGMNVFVDVFTSMGTESFIKVMDGMTLPNGMMDTCFINQGEGKTAKAALRNPLIYLFEDPVDTPEMMSFFDAIIRNNILAALKDPSQPMIPTVILAPKLSKDLSAYLDNVVEAMNKVNKNSKPPLLIVNDIYDSERYTDISLMCGCKPIKKYIDPNLQEKDIELGLAPTIETVVNFYGSAEQVESTDEYTKFINPKNMYNLETGEHTEDFNNLLASLEGKLSRAELDGADIAEIGRLKRRINSLKSNLVEYYVGGLSMTDREALRASVEDTVKNCRSAAQHGVGCAANYEGVRAAKVIAGMIEQSAKEDKNEYAQMLLPIAKIITESYDILLNILYLTAIDVKGEEATKIAYSMYVNTLEQDKPLNLTTFQHDGKVLSSIKSDIVILDTISKIVTMMYTCNQCIMPSAFHNIYITPKRYDGKDFYEPETPQPAVVTKEKLKEMTGIDMDMRNNAFIPDEQPIPEQPVVEQPPVQEEVIEHVEAEMIVEE